MANTTNFGWETPDDTDLVKDGALAMRTLGNAIDASLVDLKGGTTGQVLSKNTNTDMDFVWTTPQTGDITAVTAGTGLSGGGTSGDVTLTNTVATTFDAKGDLVVGLGADSFAKLVAGSNGDTLVADSSATTGLRWSADWNTGKNKIINGDFYWNQRNFSSTTTSGTYGFDRFFFEAAGGTVTYSAQTFTPGAAPVAGYEGRNFARLVTTGQSAAGDLAIFEQKIEDVRTLAGQTVTVSFWAKANSGSPKIFVEFVQDFGSGGSSAVVVSGGQVTLSQAWTRFSVTISVPSISGKTLGTNNLLALNLWVSAGTTFNARTSSLGIQSNTFDFWGVQVEAGSVATPFTTATGTLAGELAACQRYYFRNTANATDIYAYFGQGFTNTTTNARLLINLPVTMRVKPTSVDFTNLGIQEQFGGTIFAVSAISIGGDGGGPNPVFINATCATATGTKYAVILSNGSSTGYLGFSAEL